MHTRSIPIAAAAAACVLFVAASSSPQDPARRVANAYGDWLVAYVGKAFALSTDRALAVQDDKSPFKLVAVGQDYVAFESDSGRVCIPFAMLRIETAK